jgi:predicted lipoprotein with Yx(FWY)xxD motif
MKRIRPAFLSAAAAPLIALTVAACGSSGPRVTGGPYDIFRGGGHNRDHRHRPGQILVDSQGHTLYLFGKDTGTTTICAGGCPAAWPPLRAAGQHDGDGRGQAVPAVVGEDTDEFVHTDAGWRFASRTFETLFA